jgi:hypothetical protein
MKTIIKDQILFLDCKKVWAQTIQIKVSKLVLFWVHKYRNFNELIAWGNLCLDRLFSHLNFINHVLNLGALNNGFACYHLSSNVTTDLIEANDPNAPRISRLNQLRGQNKADNFLSQ